MGYHSAAVGYGSDFFFCGGCPRIQDCHLAVVSDSCPTYAWDDVLRRTSVLMKGLVGLKVATRLQKKKRHLGSQHEREPRQPREHILAWCLLRETTAEMVHSWQLWNSGVDFRKRKMCLLPTSMSEFKQFGRQLK